MKTFSIPALACAVAALAAAPASLAGSLSGITSVSGSGPGGSYTDGLTTTTYTEPQLRYSSVDYIDVAITFSGPGTYNINEAVSYGFVQNNTGQVWTGFDLAVLPGSVGVFVNSPSNWGDFSNILPNASVSSTDVFLSGGTVGGSGTFIEPTGYFSAPSAGTFTVRETPIAAPEPSTLTLCLAASLGAAAWRRRR